MTQAPACRSIAADAVPGASAALLRRGLTAFAFAMALAALWALTHHYHGFARDGELYALQAMARLHPWLGSDLYLQNVSQDRFTIFSPLYAAFIGAFGLQHAEMLLFAACTVALLAGAWAMMRNLVGRDEAWLAVAALILTTGYYGAYVIFNYSENYLSARSMGEAAVAIALACHFGGRRIAALAIAGAAMLVHPLMVLPGLLLLASQWVPERIAALCAAAGVAAALALACLAVALSGAPAPHAAASSAVHWLTVFDPAWLEVVRERSQFLFLQYWNPVDWEIAARPFVCLTLSALVMPDERIRRLCRTAMLVGGAGLAVACIAGFIGPDTILLQGQAWRWMWVTSFTSVVLAAPTVLRLLCSDRGAPLGALLLIGAWCVPGIDGLACADGALALWLARPYVTPRTALHLRWAGAAVAAIAILWLIANTWTSVNSPVPETGREPLLTAHLRDVFGLGISGVLAVGVLWWWLRGPRTLWSLGAAAVASLAAAAACLPGTLKQLDTVGTPAEIAAFADWRDAIPPTSTVLMVPTPKSASFMWFTLDRPSYLTVDQSSGVVFSPLTAEEVRRRSEVLAPLGPADWKIFTSIAEARRRREAGEPALPTPPPPVLTADILRRLCNDPQLGFVIAKEDVGFEPLRHRHAGAYKNWNLYDCRRVRQAGPAS